MSRILLACAFVCTALWAQDEKFGSLDGVVTGLGGQPLPKTTLRLREEHQSSAVTDVISDSEGRFHFVQMQPGFYELTGTHRGYLTTPYGRKHRFDEAIGISLAGGKAASVTLEMIPAALLSGKVVDEDGDPVPNATVKIFQSTYQNGTRRLHVIDIVGTDGRGQFQAGESLAPGRYWLAATKPALYPAEKKAEDYVTTYYPGVADESAAQPLSLTAGQESRDTVIKLMKMPVFHIRGRITGANSDVPLSAIKISAADIDLSEPEFRFRQIGVSNDGSFDMGPYRPGNYLVAALAPSARGTLVVRHNVRLGDQDITDLSLSFQPPGEVAGVVHMDGAGTDHTAPLPSLQISLEPLEPMPLQLPSQTVRNDGTFTLSRVPAGRFRLRVSGPPEVYPSSVLMGAQDALTDGFDVNSGQVVLDVRIRSNTGQISGIVTDGEKPSFGAIITLIPEPANQNRTWLYLNTDSRPDGTFTLPHVPPGKYRLYAWEELEWGDRQNLDLHKAWISKSAEVTVNEKSQETATLVQISRAEMESNSR